MGHNGWLYPPIQNSARRIDNENIFFVAHCLGHAQRVHNCLRMFEATAQVKVILSILPARQNLPLGVSLMFYLRFTPTDEITFLLMRLSIIPRAESHCESHDNEQLFHRGSLNGMPITFGSFITTVAEYSSA